MGLMEQSKSSSMFTFWKLITVLVLVIAAIWIIFGIVGVLAGIAWTIIKLAIAVAIVYLAARYLLRKKPGSPE